MRIASLVVLLLVPVHCVAAAPSPVPPAEKPKGGRATAPLISSKARVVSTPKGAEVATDDDPKNGSWECKSPSAAAPATAAIDVGKGPSRVLVWWQASGNSNYEETTYGGPGSYRIETSADSKDGTDGSWKTAVTVTDNTVMNRAHAIDFKDQRWVRLVVTGKSPQTYQYGVQLDRIAVHDISLGADDTWLFAGDSITAEVWRGGKFQPSFWSRVKSAAPRYAPAVLAAGVGFSKSGDLLAKLPKWMEWNADLQVWAIGIGSNNPVDKKDQIATFRSEMEMIVKVLQGAGKTVILARIPWQTGHEMAPLNVEIDAVTAQYKLHRGPDFYAHFKAHPDQLRDGLHPTDEGAREMHRLWFEAVRDLYGPAPK